MIIESVPLINYHIWKPVPSYFSPKPNFLQLEPIISGYILIILPKNLAYVSFVITPIPLKYLYQAYVSKEWKFSAFILASYFLFCPPVTPHAFSPPVFLSSASQSPQLFLHV